MLPPRPPLHTNSSILWKALYCIATLPKAMLSTYFSVLPRLSPMTWMARHLLRRRILASKLVVLNMQLRSLTARARCAFREGGRHKAKYSHAFIARVGAAAHTLAFPWGLQSWNILRRQLGIAFSLFFCLPTFFLYSAPWKAVFSALPSDKLNLFSTVRNLRNFLVIEINYSTSYKRSKQPNFLLR